MALSMMRDSLLSSKRAAADNAGPLDNSCSWRCYYTVTSSLLYLYHAVDRVTVSPCHCHTPWLLPNGYHLSRFCLLVCSCEVDTVIKNAQQLYFKLSKRTLNTKLSILLLSEGCFYLQNVRYSIYCSFIPALKNSKCCLIESTQLQNSSG